MLCSARVCDFHNSILRYSRSALSLFSTFLRKEVTEMLLSMFRHCLSIAFIASALCAVGLCRQCGSRCYIAIKEVVHIVQVQQTINWLNTIIIVDN